MELPWLLFRYVQSCMLVLWLLQQVIGKFATWWLLLLGLSCLPAASAKPNLDPFPDVPFKVFSDFVQHQFGSHVTLATVLTVLFSMTSNPDLLGLHARQQHPKASGEIKQTSSGWIKALAYALQERLGDAADTLLHKDEQRSRTAATLAMKLDSMSKVLGLHPYNEKGRFLGKLKPVNEADISPVHIICPTSIECETATCQSRALLRVTRERDIPCATLIKGTRLHQALVLAGQCSQCQTMYHADHERSLNSDGHYTKLYLNSAKYLKVGQSVWVDRTFAGAVVNGTYNFHASTSAFVEFWNMSFWSTQDTLARKVSRRQVWQAFVQESVRRVANVAGIDLELPDNLAIDDVTQQAFAVLGENGLMRCADGHACDECTHPFKDQADMIDDDNADPAALVGVDEEHDVPVFTGEQSDDLDINERTGSGLDEMDIDGPAVSSQTGVTRASIQMVVMDGIVIGPKHCAFPDCNGDLANYHTGVYCVEHENLYGRLCHIDNCHNPKAAGTMACAQHQSQWHAHVVHYGCSNLLGVQRLLRRSENE
jgi:hypothetical protein